MDCDKCVGWGQLKMSMRVAVVAAYVYLVLFIIGIVVGIFGVGLGLFGASTVAGSGMTNRAEKMTGLPFTQ